MRGNIIELITDNPYTTKAESLRDLFIDNTANEAMLAEILRTWEDDVVPCLSAIMAEEPDYKKED